MRDRSITIRLDEDTAIALRRLADSEDRSQAAQLRVMIRSEAQKRGLWTPRRPSVVATALAHGDTSKAVS